jgi:hypothetical protein
MANLNAHSNPALDSTLALGDSVHDALLTDDNDPSRLYEQETQAALRRKELQLDVKSYRKKLLGWLSYAFARQAPLLKTMIMIAKLVSSILVRYLPSAA